MSLGYMGTSPLPFIFPSIFLALNTALLIALNRYTTRLCFPLGPANCPTMATNLGAGDVFFSVPIFVLPFLSHHHLSRLTRTPAAAAPTATPLANHAATPLQHTKTPEIAIHHAWSILVELNLPHLPPLVP